MLDLRQKLTLGSSQFGWRGFFDDCFLFESNRVMFRNLSHEQRNKMQLKIF